MFAARVLVVCVFSPHQPAGRHVAACLTAHCACPRRLPWLLDAGGGEGLQQGRRDPSGNLGRAGREKRKVTAWWSSCAPNCRTCKVSSVPADSASHSWYQLED